MRQSGGWRARSRVQRVGGGTWSRAGGLTREVDAALHNPLSDSYNSISHLSGGASNSDGMQSCRADVRRDGDLRVVDGEKLRAMLLINPTKSTLLPILN